MKRTICVLMTLFILMMSLYGEGISRKSKTKDGYSFELYQINSQYFIELTSNNSEECFIWEFDLLNESMEHFKWLEGIDVVDITLEREDAEGLAYLVLFGMISLEEAQKLASKQPLIEKKTDKRDDWRKYSYFADSDDKGYIIYLISKSKRKDEYKDTWR